MTALEVVAPPPDGVEPLDDATWARFEGENGFRPPADYRALIDRYGAGGFGYEELGRAWLNLLNPVRMGTTLVDQSAVLRSVNAGLQRQYPATEPNWPMWPESGGFLPWAVTHDGDQAGWLTAGEPDQWTTAIYGRQMKHHRFPFGCMEFLYRCFTGSLGAQDLKDLGRDDLRFFPVPS